MVFFFLLKIIKFKTTKYLNSIEELNVLHQNYCIYKPIPGLGPEFTGRAGGGG